MLTDDEIKVQVLAAFQEEQSEHRQAIGDLLLDLERSPDHPQRQGLLDQLFREAHSLKGGARAAGQLAVEQIAHLIEDLFSAVRQEQLVLSAEVCDPIYAALDAIGALMEAIGAGQHADLQPYQPLLGMLASIRDAHSARPALVPQQKPYKLATAAPPVAPVPVDVPDLLVAATTPQLDHHHNGHDRPSAQTPQPAPAAELTSIRLSTAVLDHMLNETGELITCAVSARQRSRDIRTLADLPSRWRRTWRQIRPEINRLHAHTPTLQPIVHYLGDALTLMPSQPLAQPNSLDTTGMQRLLDALEQANTLISDMEGRLATYARQTEDDANRLGAATDRLHDQIRQTRMLPLATMFAPLRLQVREMARAADKQIVLLVEDGGIAADRQVLDRLRESLLHLLRNATDHGIEPAAVRLAAGKPAEGQISVAAAVSGEYLTLMISDDGPGLDLVQIRQRAVAHGLKSEAEIAQLSEAELSDLIFMPGFTTRQSVSALSGRGVGLDVVRTLIERTHGRVTVQSRAGLGCTFILKVPLSLTTAHCLLMRSGSVTYALPLDAIQRIVMIGPDDTRTVEGRQVLLLDGRPVSVLHLASILDRQQPAPPLGERTLALLLGSGERQVVCMVDAIVGEQELLMLRLPAPLYHLPLIAGASILADGSVVPMLDSVDLLRAALGLRQVGAMIERAAIVRPMQTILVVDDSLTTRTLEKNILESAGYRVRLATDGQAALQILEQLTEDGGCDLLLSDVDMPVMNGFDLTSAVRSDPRFQHLPVVLVTSLDTASDRERGIQAGADSYIVKRAFDQQILLETIGQLL